MRRRQLIGVLVGAAVSPLVSRAQKNLPLVAVLVPGTAKLANDRIVAIRKGMREAGLTEGVDYAFALRFADGMLDLLPGLALELGALNPRVIVASAAAAPVAHKALPELPLVFTSYCGKLCTLSRFRSGSFIGTTSILATAEFSALQSVADQFGFEIVRHPLGGLDDIEGAVAASLQDDVAGLHAVLGRGAFPIDRGDHDALAAGAGDGRGH
jgi:putative ABC transport system substrate-binding protein